MIDYQQLAENTITHLKGQIQSFDPSTIDSVPNILFVKNLYENLLAQGFDSADAKRVVFNMKIDIDEDVPEETILYLAIEYAGVISELYSMFKEDEFLAEYLMSGSSMSVQFNN